MPQPRRLLASLVAGAVLGSLVVLTAVPAAAEAEAAETTTSGNGIVRVSAYADGGQVTGDSSPEALSADGRHVLYTIHSQLWTLDRVTGRRVQQDAGATSGTITWRGRMTPDGRHVVMATTRQLVAADTNTYADVYVRDRDADVDGVLDEAGATTIDLVSVGPAGQLSTADNMEPEISDDGNVVTWQGRTTTAWGATSWRIWLRDRAAATTEQVSSSSPIPLHGLSGDGRLVAWIGMPSLEGVSVGHNERELFVRERGSPVKTPLGTTPAGRPAYPSDPTMSRDGRFLAFSSWENDLVVAESGNDSDVFVVDRTTGSWRAVNIKPDGTAGTGLTQRPRFSADSAFLTFTGSDGGLVGGDSNGHQDVFVQSLGESPNTVRVAAGHDGTQPNSYVYSVAAGDGAEHVLFGGGASNLITDDTNNRPDAFLRTGSSTPPPPPTRHTLTVTNAGTGAGTVTSAPVGISCPPTCSAEFDEGTSVSLTATPASDSTFEGFSGDCAGTSCTVSMSAAAAVTATFAAVVAAEPPQAADDSYRLMQDDSLKVAAPGVLVNDTDPEQGVLSAEVKTSTSHGALALTPDGGFTYTPQTGFTGGDSFTYTVTDEQGLTATAVVTLDVAPTLPPKAPVLAVTATTGTTDAVVGEPFTVAGNASNTGTAAATGVVLELTATAATIVGGTPAACSTVSPTAMRCPLGDLAPGQTVPYELQLRADAPGTARVVARLSCTCDSEAATASATRTVAPAPKPSSLGVLVSGPVAVVQGDKHVYTWQVHNGNAAAASRVILYLTAGGKSGFSQPIAGATATQGTCKDTKCEIGTIPAGSTVTVTATVHALFGIDFSVHGTVTCSCQDPVTSDNVSSLPVAVTAKVDLTLSYKTATPTSPGSPISWLVSVDGLSGARVPRLVVEFDVPAGVKVTTVTVPRGAPPATCVTTGQLVRCTWSPASGTPRVQIAGIPPGGGSYVLIGRIVDCGGCVDPNTRNDVVAAPPVVVPNLADLSITKKVMTAGPYMVGDVISWRIAVANAGPDAATATRVLDRVPAGFTFVGATPSQGSCVLRNGALTCELGAIPAGNSASVDVQLRPTSGQRAAINTASTWCDCWEPVGSPSNTASSDPIKVELSVKPVKVTPCPQFTSMSYCQLAVHIPNVNTSPLPSGGTITFGPMDPTDGPRLHPDATFPRGMTCTDRGTNIACTLPAVPVGGLRFTMPLLFSGAGAWTGSVSWACGCWSGGAVQTALPPIRQTQACIGGQVLFHSTATGDDDIYAARLDGSGYVNLTDNVVTDEADAVWAPDGRHFVFNRGDAQAQNRRLWIAALDRFGCIKRQWKVPGQPNADNYQADWSATGNRLAFISKSRGNHDIWTIGTDGSSLHQVTTDTAPDRAPSWRGDGLRIAFARNLGTVRSPNWDIFTTTENGDEQWLGGGGAGNPSAGADYSPTYSRGVDQNQIIWHTNVSGNWDLWIMDDGGAHKRKMDRSTTYGEKNAEWSDDGEHVVYDGDTGASGIWLMRSDGTRRHLIADTGGYDQAPSIIKAEAPPYPCGQTSESGGYGVTERVTEMGRSSGTFTLDYDTYSVPDQIEVLYQGEVIWSSGGPVAGPGSVPIFYRGSATQITVRVTGETQGTAWRYTAGCPA